MPKSNILDQSIEIACPSCGHNFVKPLAELYADPQFDLVCGCGKSFGPDASGIQTALKSLFNEIDKLDTQLLGKGISFGKR